MSQYPLKIQQLQALTRRLPKHHEKFQLIEDDLAKALAGHLGEQSVQYYYRFLDQDQFKILTDIRLTIDKEYYFQMDTIILSQNFFVILEIKNYTGSLFFDSSFNQMIRYIGDKEEGFPDPILQVSRQKQQFSQWLAKRKFPQIPIIGLVIISHPTTIIKTGSTETEKYVLHAENLPLKIRQLQSIYSRQLIPNETIRKIKQKMMREHKPYRLHPLDYYKLSYETLLKGIYCPNCSFYKMKRIYAYWYCPRCKIKSKDAHLAALKDYSLLISNQITNRKFRDFLELNSKYTAIRLLKEMNLKSEGSGWHKIYFLPF